MNYVDSKYINLISVYLDQFKQQSSELFNFRCPICGDSKKNKFKRRGYLYAFDDVVAFRCHNCGAGMSLANLIKHFSVDLWKRYCFERFYNGEKRTPQQRAKDDAPSTPKPAHENNNDESALSGWSSIAELPETHPAKRYVQGRRIPEVRHSGLYYTSDLRQLYRKIPRYVDRVPGLPETALLIPFFDDSLELTFIQARVLDPNAKKRYQTFQVKEGGSKLWGLDQVDWNKLVWVFEGPIDAMMVDNGIAVAGGSLPVEIKYLNEKCHEGFVFVFDNDYKSNFEVFHHFRKSIEAGVPVVFFDKKFTYKDVNEAIQDGWTREGLLKYLRQHVKQGLEAQLALSEFKQPSKR